MPWHWVCERSRRACSVSLPAGSPEMTAYLRGQPFASPGENGSLLIAVEGYPLGWGNASAERSRVTTREG